MEYKEIRTYFGRFAILVMVASFLMFSSCSKSTSVKETSRGRSPEKTKRPSKIKQPSQATKIENKIAGSDGVQPNVKIALMVVDIQQDFFDSQTELSNPAFVSNTATALDACRKSGIEVIHVRTAFPKDESKRPKSFQKFFGSKIPCVLGTPGIKPLECARQHNNEKVFYKMSFDPFENKELAEYLAKRDIEKLLVCGLTTDVCVLSTCFSSTNKGYLTTLVEDCCATANPMAHQFVVKRYQGMIFDTIKSSEIESKYSERPSDGTTIRTSIQVPNVQLKP